MPKTDQASSHGRVFSTCALQLTESRAFPFSLRGGDVWCNHWRWNKSICSLLQHLCCFACHLAQCTNSIIPRETDQIEWGTSICNASKYTPVWLIIECETSANARLYKSKTSTFWPIMVKHVSPVNQAKNGHFQIFEVWTFVPALFWFLVVCVVKMWSGKSSRKDSWYQDYSVLLTSPSPPCHQMPSPFLPETARNVWTQAVSILVERTINQNIEVLLFV